jgi:hypothetical protein
MKNSFYKKGFISIEHMFEKYKMRSEKYFVFLSWLNYLSDEKVLFIFSFEFEWIYSKKIHFYFLNTDLALALH